MYTRSITQDDIAELLRQITTARARADAEKSTESTIELAKKQAETAEAFLIMGDVNESESLFAHSLDSLSAVNQPAVTADFCERIGKVFLRAGKTPDAAEFFSKALETRETLPQNTPESRAELLKLYKIYAETLMRTGRIQDAIALLSKCRDLMRCGYENTPSLSDLMGWAGALYALGGAYGHSEDHETSYKLYQEAMALYLQAEKEFKADTRREAANCLISIGGIFELQKDYDQALENYLKALEINRRLAVKDGDEQALKHLASSCTHTAELYETMGRLVEALGLFREKADVNLRLLKLKPVIEPPEILFLAPCETFNDRLERLESKLPWYSLLYEMEENPSRDKMYITYFTMGRLAEKLARQLNDCRLLQEALCLYEASEKILCLMNDEFPEMGLESKLREVKSCAKKVKTQINQEG